MQALLDFFNVSFVEVKLKSWIPPHNFALSKEPEYANQCEEMKMLAYTVDIATEEMQLAKSIFSIQPTSSRKAVISKAEEILHTARRAAETHSCAHC